ncbi:MAG: carbohydrate kinase family protein, partial [Balneolaceae bacterium]
MDTPKKYDLMVVGELNIDLILDQLNKAPRFGEEQRAEDMTLTMGSSTAIFASNCTSLGSDVAFCGKVGTDNFGKYVMEALSARGIYTDFVIVDEKLKTGATIIFNYMNDRMMVTYPGAMESLTVEEIPTDLFKKSRHLHTSSIFFQPRIKNNLVTLFKKAKKHGLTTSMDTQWDPDEKWELHLEKLLPELDFFLPNEQELLLMTATG